MQNMSKAKEMILADALEVAISKTKENLILKRIIIVLVALCGLLMIKRGIDG